MPSPDHKRRRLDDASKTLAKPFKSPLKVDPTAESRKQVDSAEFGSKGEDSNSTETVRQPKGASTEKRSLNLSSPFLDVKLPDVLETSNNEHSQSIRELESKIRATREEINNLSQATKILHSGRDEDLERLASKWKIACQSAAEELFAVAKDKVNRIGGVGSWKEAERKRLDWRNMWESESNQRAAKGEMEDDETLDRATQTEIENEVQTVSRQSPYDENDGGVDSCEDSRREGTRENNEAFTMDMMLGSLNIELDMIGFDAKEQRWA